ncbi:hypothetical protein J4458_06250 [Candidatus Woesearchaeota archaeon]|nr:hypothetical protein [Candidatus Woesearchaeota archaeon]
MSRKFALIALSLMLLVLIASCQSQGTSSGAAPKTPFLGGSTGLFIEFEKGSPPEEVTDRGTFDFNAIVKLRNDGEFDIRKDKVKVDLIGILPQDFDSSPEDLNDKSPADDLTAKKRDAEGNIVEGITSFVAFPNEAETFNFPGALQGNQEFTFRADVCYLYQTRAVATLCILKDLVNVRDDAICDPSQTKTMHSSGAPVHAANFKQSVVGKDKIGFSFDITHSSNGIIFKSGASDAPDADCPKGARERRSKEDRVKVTVNTGLSNLRCTGLDGGTTGHVTLVSGKRTVTCTQDLDPNRNDFEKPMEITLDYNYNDDKETKVLVKHLIDNS